MTRPDCRTCGIGVDAALLLPTRLQLGEGLYWDDCRGLLRFVDIHGAELYAFDPKRSRLDRWTAPQRVGWVLPIHKSDVLLAGFQHGVARCHLRAQGEMDRQWVRKLFADSSPLRLNDAKADSSGAIWLGSLNNDDESTPDGALYRLGPDGQLSVQDEGYLVANGPALSANERIMLHTDSGRRTIYAFDLDTSAGLVAGKRVWKRFSEDEGYPDGMCFDAEDCLWVAHWGAGCVSRYSLEGALLRRVRVPAPHVTNIAFGGDKLDRLFVTTARVGLSAEELADYPASGGVFEIDAGGVRGLPGHAAAAEFATLQP